jgi:hypothetical protein
MCVKMMINKPKKKNEVCGTHSKRSMETTVQNEQKETMAYDLRAMMAPAPVKGWMMVVAEKTCPR